MTAKLLSVLIFLSLYAFRLHAQEKTSIKFGHVSQEDFDISKLTVDTTNGAVIIAEKGYSSFEGNNKGWFSLVYNYQARIRIINKNGFSLANVRVPLYKNGEDEEQLQSVKGVTYNIENGQVVETKLGKDATFEDKYDKKYIFKKFTLPAVKEGSIIEYSYTVHSDFLFNLQPWEFQGEYPKVWSEYEVDIPEFFEYVFLAQGYLPFTKEESFGTESYHIRVEDNSPFGRDNVVTEAGTTAHTHWTMKNIPALKEENFTSCIKNHISKIEFQMAGIKLPDRPYEPVMGDWPGASKELIEREDFGVAINKNNGWLSDELKSIAPDTLNELDKARAIYYYVKNNIKSTQKKGILIESDLKNVFKNKSGSVAEINMLLIAMLRHEHINAAPVILSTRDNGNTFEIYPTISQYNYLICRVLIDTSVFFLDATESYLGFGRLPLYCYNGHARIIDKEALPVYFYPDTLHETKTTDVILLNDSIIHGKWNGQISSNLDYKESGDIRERVLEKGKDEFEKNLKASYPEEFSLSNITLKNLTDCEKTVQTNYDLSINENNDNGDIIYFNPIIKEGGKENPLKSADRKYPVEMPSLTDETYNLSLEIPDGYEVDELPKSAKITFNDDEALFEYYISNGGTIINLQSHLKFSKATFAQDDYQNLRAFFDYVVKKNAEQIVFKKKK
jgi:hypothetical protein